MISSLCWVPRGAAAERPSRFEMTPAARTALEKAMAGAERSDQAAAAKVDRHGLPAELRMDDYGEDHDDALWESELNEEDASAAASRMEEAIGEMSDSDNEDAAGAASGKNAEEDPEDDDDDEDDENGNDEDDDDKAMQEQLDNILNEDEDDLGSDEEDLEVRETDRLIVVAHTDEECSNLEVYLYDSEEGNMYVHHDIALPAFPLSTAWIGAGPEVFGDRVTTQSRNYVGVGTFKPEIEIWNLDILDAFEPTLVLGEEGSADAHTDAVLSIAWNPHHPSLLASASADKTVKVWDLSTGKCALTFTHHTDKVQAVQWNPVETSVLLSGSFDKSIAVFDANAPGTAAVKLSLPADVESCIWNPHAPQQVLASTEDGTVTCYDVRNVSAGPLFSFAAHPRKPCSSISISPVVRGLMATCSPDKTVKIWDLEAEGGPACVGERQMQAGSLFDVKFDVNEPFMLATGGDQGELAVWDLSSEANIAKVFKARAEGVAEAEAVAPPAAPVEVEAETAAASAPKSAKKSKSKKAGKN